MSAMFLASSSLIWPLVPQQLPASDFGGAASPAFWVKPQQADRLTSTASATFEPSELQHDDFDASLSFSTFLVSSL
jgi:hypothetical protein